VAARCGTIPSRIRKCTRIKPPHAHPHIEKINASWWQELAGDRTVSDAEAVLEDRLDADLSQPGVDLRAASMHQDAADAHARQEHQVRDDARLRKVCGSTAWMDATTLLG
jgi:hypothetical protein